MLKATVRSLIALALLMAAASAEEGIDHQIGMPAGFGDVHLGMTVGELLASHPQATVHPMDRHVSKPGADPETRRETLFEFAEKDSLLGLKMLATYVFGNGTLESMSIIWMGDTSYNEQP